MDDSEKLQALRSQIKELEQNKTTLTDVDKIKAINKQINALQMEFGLLREKLKNERAFQNSIEREYLHCMEDNE